MFNKSSLSRFAKAVVRCALAALVVASLTLPMVITLMGNPLLDATGKAEGFGETLIGALLLLPFGIVIGSVLALPAALVLGTAMLLLIGRYPSINRPLVWMTGGILVSMPATLIVGTDHSFVPDRLIIGGWLAMSGLIGGEVFRRVWNRPHIGATPDS
jgi:hypothetical protein